MDANEPGMKPEEKLLFKDEAYAIVGAAMEVHSVLGPGFLEGVFADAMAYELHQRGIVFQREVRIPVYYKGIKLPHAYRADFLVGDGIILELKAIKALGEAEKFQALHYLRATGLKLAILLNFGSAKLDWTRVVCTK